MIPYPTEDYKKYIYALGMHRVRRLHDLVGGLGADVETSDDVTCSLRQLQVWLYLAAFVDDDDAGNEIGWNVRDLMAGDPVNTYSDGRPVATTIRWDGGWVMSGTPTRNTPRTNPAKSWIWKKNRDAGEGWSSRHLASWIPSRATRKSACTNPRFGSVNSLMQSWHNNFDNRAVYISPVRRNLGCADCPGPTKPF